MKKKRILMVCEAFGGGVFTYVSQLCNDMVDEFDVYLAYSLRSQTPKNYTDFLDQRVHLIEMENVGVKGLTNLKSDIAAIKELRQIEKDVKPDVIHLHSSVAGGLGRLAYRGRDRRQCNRRSRSSGSERCSGSVCSVWSTCYGCEKVSRREMRIA